jgi:protein-S-isoprenylcysteine O-methyltransferase Ste14
MRPYIETHHIWVVWLVLWVATAIIEVAGVARRRTEATKKDMGSRVVLRLCIFPGVIVLAASPKIAPGAEIHPPLVAVVVGMVIFAAGEALRIWAKAALGRYFTYTVMTSSDQTVITSGPYRYVRHPSYTGILLIAIGAGTVWDNWLGLGAVTLGTLVGLAYRIYVEEKALLDELGDRYRTYAQDHKRLIPRVW